MCFPDSRCQSARPLSSLILPLSHLEPSPMSRAATEYRYEKLTWPEINDAVDLGKVCILPCGADEQHGHHLPLDVDLVCPGGIAKGGGPGAGYKDPVPAHDYHCYTGARLGFSGPVKRHHGN